MDLKSGTNINGIISQIWVKVKGQGHQSQKCKKSYFQSGIRKNGPRSRSQGSSSRSPWSRSKVVSKFTNRNAKKISFSVYYQEKTFSRSRSPSQGKDQSQRSLIGSQGQGQSCLVEFPWVSTFTRPVWPYNSWTKVESIINWYLG